MTRLTSAHIQTDLLTKAMEELALVGNESHAANAAAEGTLAKDTVAEDTIA